MPSTTVSTRGPSRPRIDTPSVRFEYSTRGSVVLPRSLTLPMSFLRMSPAVVCVASGVALAWLAGFRPGSPPPPSAGAAASTGGGAGGGGTGAAACFGGAFFAGAVFAALLAGVGSSCFAGAATFFGADLVVVSTLSGGNGVAVCAETADPTTAINGTTPAIESSVDLKALDLDRFECTLPVTS